MKKNLFWVTATLFCFASNSNAVELPNLKNSSLSTPFEIIQNEYSRASKVTIAEIPEISDIKKWKCAGAKEVAPNELIELSTPIRVQAEIQAKGPLFPSEKVTFILPQKHSPGFSYYELEDNDFLLNNYRNLEVKVGTSQDGDLQQMYGLTKKYQLTFRSHDQMIFVKQVSDGHELFGYCWQM